jgi:uncharacterized protein
MTALITGASGGIGLELAKIFAREGHNLVLTARREDKLEELKTYLERDHGINAHVFALDLSQPGACDRLIDAIEQKGITIDCLVNNAGFGDTGHYKTTDPEREIEMLNLNIVALSRLTKRIFPSMVKRAYGRILNVSSLAAYLPGPLMTVYYASKAYVLSYSQALAIEAMGTGVTVTVLCPGPTVSGFQEAASMQDSKILKLMPIPTARSVAEYGYKAMMQGKITAIHGWMNKLIVFSVRLFPRSWVARMAYLVH